MSFLFADLFMLLIMNVSILELCLQKNVLFDVTDDLRF